MSGIPSWARVGAKVVCVDAAWISPVSPLREGAVYTIAGFCDSEAKHDAVLWIGHLPPSRCDFILAEATNPTELDGFHPSRFRPLISQEDDIETHFKALLDVPEQVGA